MESTKTKKKSAPPTINATQYQQPKFQMAPPPNTQPQSDDFYQNADDVRNIVDNTKMPESDNTYQNGEDVKNSIALALQIEKQKIDTNNNNIPSDNAPKKKLPPGAVNMMGPAPVLTGVQLKPTPKPQQAPPPKQNNAPLVTLVKVDSQEGGTKSKPPPSKPVSVEEPKPKPKPPIPKSTSIPEDLSSKAEKPNQNSKAIDLIKEEIFLLNTLKQKAIDSEQFMEAKKYKIRIEELELSLQEKEQNNNTNDSQQNTNVQTTTAPVVVVESKPEPKPEIIKVVPKPPPPKPIETVVETKPVDPKPVPKSISKATAKSFYVSAPLNEKKDEPPTQITSTPPLEKKRRICSSTTNSTTSSKKEFHQLWQRSI